MRWRNRPPTAYSINYQLCTINFFHLTHLAQEFEPGVGDCPRWTTIFAIGVLTPFVLAHSLV
ncbi:MAG: hypothetical protein NT154_33680 [Verrucomicrobia bacterium]|nr:hypothetical protein [Verrucomicrobiota bacterium]